jgi:hypothetical protein
VLVDIKYEANDYQYQKLIKSEAGIIGYAIFYFEYINDAEIYFSSESITNNKIPERIDFPKTVRKFHFENYR